MIAEKLDLILSVIQQLVQARVRELESQSVIVPITEILSDSDQTLLLSIDPEAKLNIEEATILGLAVTPHLNPHLLDEAIAGALTTSADYPRIGGNRGKDSRLFLPTGETALFLLGVRSAAERLQALIYLGEDSPLVKRKMLSLRVAEKGEPVTSGGLDLGDGVLEGVLYLPKKRPKLGPDFPAERIETDLDWEDLILENQTRRELTEIETWIAHGQTLLNEWGMKRFLKPGYRALFFGPPGTGKTLAASLMGKYTGRDVYRIDLSMIVSKFIGETEKNLAKVFDQAENSDWILFFDEADALFGKRTSVKDSHDRYANQEVSYLLQRVESFNGLVILASNFINNIDDAFLRRFPSVIHFPKPSAVQRVKLWNNMLPSNVGLEESVNLKELCRKHEFTGANIANIIQHASLQALDRLESVLSLKDIEKGIAKEYEKEGKLG